MTPGEPLEEIKDGDRKTADSALAERAMDGPVPDRPAPHPIEMEVLLRAPERAAKDESDDARAMEEEAALLDQDVRTLLNEIAEEEAQHDEKWVAASRHEAEEDGTTFAALERGGMDEPDEPDEVMVEDTETGNGFDTAPVHPGDDREASAPPADESVALRAIEGLGTRFETAEARTEEALGRIGHALGMIATRIDGLEARATDRTIADVALVAAPPDEDDEDDTSVAPYIARAEKELKARKGSGSMDIFDRIARAAETEFDDQAGSAETRILANPTDGRRVGTKKWQPSKAVKRRMEKLEQARASKAGDGAHDGHRAPASALDAQAMEEPVAPVHAAQLDEPDMAAEAPPEPAFVPEDDEGNLSVVPGARGRRRNRARKSSLDSDFENVFSEEGDKPSIQSLRRKMRDRPVEAPVEDEKTMGGMLGGMLGRKSARKGNAPEPVVDDENVDDEMMAAFDAPEDNRVDSGAPATPKKKKRTAAANSAEPEDDYEDDEDDWDDEDEAATGAGRKGLVTMLIVLAAAAAGYVVWKMFLA